MNLTCLENIYLQKQKRLSFGFRLFWRVITLLTKPKSVFRKKILFLFLKTSVWLYESTHTCKLILWFIFLVMIILGTILTLASVLSFTAFMFNLRSKFIMTEALQAILRWVLLLGIGCFGFWTSSRLLDKTDYAVYPKITRTAAPLTKKQKQCAALDAELLRILDGIYVDDLCANAKLAKPLLQNLLWQALATKYNSYSESRYLRYELISKIKDYLQLFK